VFNIDLAASVISSMLSECAKTFEAKIKSTFLGNLCKIFLSKKELIVGIFFLFARSAKFFAGSIPRTFLKPIFKKLFILYNFFLRKF
jgi:hypothetical protein